MALRLRVWDDEPCRWRYSEARRVHKLWLPHARGRRRAFNTAWPREEEGDEPRLSGLVWHD